MGMQFNTLLRAILAGGGVPPPAPATIYSTYNDQPSALGGFCLEPSGGRWNLTASSTAGGAMGGCFAYRIKGSSASMFAYGGDTTPFRVVVDSDDLTTSTAPTLSGGKMPLFSGLSDTWHTVFIWTDNSETGQGFPNGANNLIEAYGSAAQVLPMGMAYNLGDTAFPGVVAGPRIDTTYYPQPKKQMIGSSSQTTWGGSASSVHMRATYDNLYMFCSGSATHVMVSINGALATACALSTHPGANAAGLWRKVDTPSQSTVAEIIISGGGKETAGAISVGVIMQGVMVTGSSASIAAPTATKRHVVMIGASQVEGVVTGATGYRNDGHLVQNRLNIYLTNNGLAGGTITGLNTAIPTVATKYPTKDIAMLSVGINSADDANFQTDYTTLIQSCLTAGWSKVICRGLVTTTAQTSKNAKIAAAVASFSSAAVVYADVASWVATTDGSGGTIAMPDGAHPNAAGFAKMADLWYSDHASLFA